MVLATVKFYQKMAYSLLQLALVTRESDDFSFLLFATERTVEFFGKDDIGFIYCGLAKFLASFALKAGLFCFWWFVWLLLWYLGWIGRQAEAAKVVASNLPN